MSLKIGDVYARIGLQIATGQFNTASQAIRSLGYDVIYLNRHMDIFNTTISSGSKLFGSYSQNIKTMQNGIKQITSGFATATKDFGNLTGNLDSLTAGLSRAVGGMKTFGVGLASLAGNIVLTGAKITVFAGIVAGLTALGVAKWIYNVHSEFEKLNVRLRYVTGSAYSASKAMEWVKRFAKETPLDVAGVTDAFAKLQEKGINAVKNLPKIVDAVVGVGGSEKQLDGIIYALTQMSSLPKGIAQEFRQLANQGVNAISLLNNYFDLNLKSAADAVSYFGSGAKVAEAIMTAMGEKFKGIAEEMNSTFSGQVQELKDNFWSLAAEVGEKGALGGIRSVVVAINKKFEEWANSGDIDKIAKDISNKLGTALRLITNMVIDLTQALLTAYKWSLTLFSPIDTLRANALNQYTKNVEDLTSKFGANSPQAKKAKEELRLFTEVTKKNAPEIFDYAQKLKDVNDTINSSEKFQKNLNKTMLSGVEVYASTTDEQIRLAQASGEINKTLHKQGLGFNELGQIVDEYGNIYDTTGKLIIKATKEASGSVEGTLSKTNKAVNTIIKTFKNETAPTKDSILGWLGFGGDVSSGGDSIIRVVNETRQAIAAINAQYAKVGQLKSEDAENKRVEIYKTAQDRIDKIFSDSAQKQEDIYNNHIKELTKQLNLFSLANELALINMGTSAGGITTAKSNAQIEQMNTNLQYQTGGISWEEKQLKDQIATKKIQGAVNGELVDYGKQIGVITDSSVELSNVFNKYQDMVRNGIITQKQANSAVDKFSATLTLGQAQPIANAIGSNVGGAVSMATSFMAGDIAGGVGAAISLMAENSPEMADALSSINDTVGEIFASLGKALAPVVKLIARLLAKVAPLLTKIIDAIAPILDVLVDVISPVLELVFGAVEPLADLVKIIANMIKSIGNIGGNLTDFVSNIPIVGGVVDSIGDVVDDVFGGIFHDGGSVGAPFKYHSGASAGLPSGTFKADEVPAILQTGEIVLSRSMVREAKSASMSNNGGSGGDVSTQVLSNINHTLTKMLRTQQEWQANGLPVLQY